MASKSELDRSDIVVTLATRYGLNPREAEELYDLLKEMAPMEFNNSKHLSSFIYEHKLGYKYPDISGVIRMRQGDKEWDFKGGFPPAIYRAICVELDLGNQGSKARPVKFTSFKELFNNG